MKASTGSISSNGARSTPKPPTVSDATKKANENYIDQGIRLLEPARNAAWFYRKHEQ